MYKTYTHRMQWLWNNCSLLCLCRRHFFLFLSILSRNSFTSVVNSIFCTYLFTAMGKIGIGGKLENLAKCKMRVKQWNYYCIKMQMQTECIQWYSVAATEYTKRLNEKDTQIAFTNFQSIHNTTHISLFTDFNLKTKRERETHTYSFLLMLI